MTSLNDLSAKNQQDTTLQATGCTPFLCPWRWIEVRRHVQLHEELCDDLRNGNTQSAWEFVFAVVLLKPMGKLMVESSVSMMTDPLGHVMMEPV